MSQVVAGNPTLNRSGRGQVSATEMAHREDRERWLTEDVDATEFEAAIVDEDLSDASVHTSDEGHSSDGTQPSANEGAAAESGGTPAPGATNCTAIDLTETTTESETNYSEHDLTNETQDVTWASSDNTFNPEQTDNHIRGHHVRCRLPTGTGSS